MKFITKSIPYYGIRQVLVDGIIIHYISAENTAPQTPHDFEEVFKILNDYKLSYHYVIDRQGKIYSLVNHRFRAYHAGHGHMFDDSLDCNHHTIGIAFINRYNEEYSKKALCAGIQLVKYLRGIYPSIPLNRILGHEHVDSVRKLDPGPTFPWVDFLILRF